MNRESMKMGWAYSYGMVERAFVERKGETLSSRVERERERERDIAHFAKLQC